MRVVPVIDLAGGLAVHAVRGDRDRYRPVESRLAPEAGADPIRLLAAFRDRLGATACYVADLDAIGRRGDNAACLSAMAAVPGVSLWVDAGVSAPAQAQVLLARTAGPDARVVVGTETLPDLETLAAVAAALGPARVVASVDVRAGRLLWGAAGRGARPGDPAAVARAASDLGLAAAIVLDLARVGSREGPDLDLVARLAPACAGLPLFAGGGVRDARDLEALASAGAAGVLVATALHDGRLPAAARRGEAGPPA